MMLRKTLAFLAVLALLSACRAGFPTDKFVRAENGVNRHLIFMNGGRWEGYFDGNLVTFGAYRVEGERLHFESDYQCEEMGAQVQAAYTWSYTDERLSFQPAGEDGCAERREMLTGAAYTRSQ
jgi:hypothetical protein